MKIWPAYFDAVVRGEKRFEFRQDDRGGFWPGDVLRLREWRPERQDYTGRETRQRITYVMELVEYLGGHAILSIEPEEREEAERALSTARAEIERRDAARARVFARFGHAARGTDGTCQGPYCTQDGEALAEVAASYEMDKECAEAALALSRVEVERLRAAYTELDRNDERMTADLATARDERYHWRLRADAAEAEVERLNIERNRALRARDHYDEERRASYQEVGGWKERAMRAEAAEGLLSALRGQVEQLKAALRVLGGRPGVSDGNQCWCGVAVGLGEIHAEYCDMANAALLTDASGGSEKAERKS